MELRDIFSPVNDDLERVREILQGRLCRYGSGNTELKNYVLCNTGKMIRPALLMLSARSTGAIGSDKLLEMTEIAAVVELIHTASLLHDDVLDNGEIRRHLPTVNAKWGNKTAILLGDYLYSAAFSMMLKYPQYAEDISSGAMAMCEGEITQNARSNDLDMSEEEYISIITAKSARMFELPCRIGARIAGAASAAVDAFAGYGKNIGIAYQIFDDLMDIAGSDDEAGKSLGSDALQEKMTLPLLYLRDISPQFLQYSCRKDMNKMTGLVLEKIYMYLNRAKESVQRIPGSIYFTALRDLAEEFAECTAVLYERKAPLVPLCKRGKISAFSWRQGDLCR